MASDHLFVYGTLRNYGADSMHHLLAGLGDLVGLGQASGRLYEIHGYPGLVPARRPDETVRGEVYRLRNPRKALLRLDDYEACSERFPPPREYRRVRRPVTLDDGKQLLAWIYLYNRPTRGLERIDSGDYLAYIALHQVRRHSYCAERWLR